MKKSTSFFRSRKLTYRRGWSIDRLKEVFLFRKLPIPVYKEIDARVVQREIDRLFGDQLKRLELLEEITCCLSNIYNPSNKKGMMLPDHKHAIILTDYNESPNLLYLLGIIREFAFRNIGGGTADVDLDTFDFSSQMRQLIVINLEAFEKEDLLGVIFGAYRYKVCSTPAEYHAGSVGMYFEFSDEFMAQERGELGRSMMNPIYLRRQGSSSFDPVLYGLSYLKVIHPNMVGFFGKITLYKQYELLGAEKYFLGVAKKYWQGKERNSVQVKPELRVIEEDLEDDPIFEKNLLRVLHATLDRKFSLGVPPILAIYDKIAGLSKLSYFGAFKHYEFGESTEVGMAIHFEDLKPSIVEQFIRPIEESVAVLR